MKSPASVLVASSSASAPAKARDAEPTAIAVPIRKLRRSIAIELVEPYCQAGGRSKLAADELANAFQVKTHHTQLALAVGIALRHRPLFYRSRSVVFESVPGLRYPLWYPSLLL